MKDYWTFKAVLRSFKATGYGKIREIDGLEWRVRGGDYVLLTPPQKFFTVPPESNRSRIRSMCFLEDAIGVGIPVKKPNNLWVYEITDDWVRNKKCNYAMRLAERDGAELITPTREDLLGVFDKWLKWVAERRKNEMIVKGHYTAMIDDPGFEFIACKLGGEVIGASGFTREGEHAAVSFTKHISGVWWLSRYLWITTLEILLRDGAKTINCGDTADVFKRELGASPVRQWRVDFSRIP